jgi:predicted dehydrogenase
MKLMIAGLGSIGRRHLRNLLALGERDILLYRTHHSTLPDEELAPFPVETDLDAALAHQPDAVIVSNPTALHLDVAIPAARAGCHLLLEKPISDRMDNRVNTLNEIVAEKELQVLVGYQFRFHPVLTQIKALLQTGELGKPLSVRAHWGEYLPGWHPWEDYRQGYAARKSLGGGVVNTLCHPLDYLRWLFGEVDSLTAMTGQVSQLDLDVEDVAEILLNFNTGMIGSVHLDYFQRPPAHWLEINAENGHIRWENATAEARVYSAQDKAWQTLSPPDGFDRNQLFMEETRHFLALVRGEEPSRCSLSDGIRSLQMTEAVHHSASSGTHFIFSS